MRYIDADALLNNLPDDLPYKASVKRVLIQAPTEDVVEVVRCKDCLYFNKTHPCSGICREHGVSFNHNDYCRYGIRREDTDGT